MQKLTLKNTIQDDDIEEEIEWSGDDTQPVDVTAIEKDIAHYKASSMKNIRSTVRNRVDELLDSEDAQSVAFAFYSGELDAPVQTLRIQVSVKKVPQILPDGSINDVNQPVFLVDFDDEELAQEFGQRSLYAFASEFFFA